MSRFFNSTTVVAGVGFAIGYYVGRNYDLTFVVKKVK